MTDRLFDHMRELHPMQARNLSTRITLAELQRLHGRIHWRLYTGHVHAGVNLGPNDRPRGWKTGEDVVMK